MQPHSENKSVMLIDDDAVTNMINTKVIKMNSNFDVHVFVNAQFALKHLQQCCQSSPEKLPFLIFLDINMPVMDGWEFLEEFQNLPAVVHATSKIVVLTSSIDAEDNEKSKTYTVVSGFISKPLTVQKLKELM